MSINLNLDSSYALEGELLEVKTYPDPVLKKIAAPVISFDDDLKKIP